MKTRTKIFCSAVSFAFLSLGLIFGANAALNQQMDVSNSIKFVANDVQASVYVDVSKSTRLKFSKIEAADMSSFGISDGKLYSWGYNYFGQLGLGVSELNSERKSPEQVPMPSGVTKFTDIAGGGGVFSMALTDAGDIYSCGANEKYQLGLDNLHEYVKTTLQKVTKPDGVNKFTDIDAGSYHCMALTDTGEIYSWGKNNNGELGLGTFSEKEILLKHVPKPSEINKFAKICAGSEYSFALTDSGEIYSWGDNAYGQLGLGTAGYNQDANSPQHVNKPSGVTFFTDIAACFNHSFALTDAGKIYSWGRNMNGELGLGYYDTPKTTPQLVSMPSGVEKFTSIAAGYNHTLALTDTGDIYSWGINDVGQLGLGNKETPKITPQKVEANGIKFTDISAGYNHSLALTKDQKMYSWGRNFWGELGLGTSGEGTEQINPQKIITELFNRKKIGPGTSGATPSLSFTKSEQSQSKILSIPKVSLKGFTDDADYYEIAFFVYNLGTKDIFFTLPSSVDTTDQNALTAKIASYNSNTKIIIEPYSTNGSYYWFSIKWQVSSLEADVTNSLKDFDVKLSGYAA